MRDPCKIPPGREWAVRNCLAEVPGPIWERYIGTGEFPQGIQKGLEDTAACHVNVDVYVKSGSSSTLIPNVRIPGFFPWGWYKVCATSATPPPPQETLRRFAQDATVATRVVADRPVLDPMTGAPLVETLEPDTCDVVPVPTIDMLLPSPYVAGWVYLGAERIWVLPGDYGRWCVRLPGSSHPMFSTGYGIGYAAREFMSPLGLRVLEYWDTCRRQWCQERYFARGRENSFPVILFGQVGGPGGAPAGSANDQVRQYTRDYQASHMQCLSPNRFPSGAADPQGIFAALGLAGQPVQWRWRDGGLAPRGGVGDADNADAYGEFLGTPYTDLTYTSRRLDTTTLYYTPSGLKADGTLHAADAPEYPFGFRDRWDVATRQRTASDLWTGPAPGTFA